MNVQTQTKPQAADPLAEIRAGLASLHQDIKDALPRHVSPEKFMKAVVTAVQLDPRLLRANRQSFWNAVLRAAQSGLLPDKREGFFNVRGKDNPMATWEPMIGGICKLARNSGEISSIDAFVVYEKDEFESWVDEKGPHFKYKRTTADPGNPVLTFAYAITKAGGVYVEEVDEAQMAAIEKKSQAKEDSPWKGPFRDEMKRKSALRRLCKYRVPSATDLDPLIGGDDLPDEIDPEPVPAEPEPTPAPSRSSRLSAAVKPAAAPAPEPEPEPSDDGDII